MSLMFPAPALPVTSDMISCLLSEGEDGPAANQRPGWGVLANERRAQEMDVLSLKVSLYVTGLLNIQPLQSVLVSS